MSDNQEAPPEWNPEDGDSWTHGRLGIQIGVIGIGQENDVQITPLPKENSGLNLRLNIRRDSRDESREDALEYMREFNDIELDIREEHSELSETRQLLLASTEAVINLREA